MKMRTIRKYYGVVMAAFLVSFGAQAVSQAAQMDSDIESSIKNSYNFKKYLKNDNINVKADNGVVTLSGTASSDANKSLAQETAVNTAGVKNVDNRIDVKGASQAAGPTSDAWITAKVKTSLLFSKNVSAKTDVTTNNGVVTLRGAADNQAQKDLTTEYAKDVEGVKDVKNEMTVSSSRQTGQAAGGASAAAMNGAGAGATGETTGEKIDDASITAQVKLKLLYNRSTSAMHTSIKTNNGVVTVTGQAKNGAEKDLVTKLVKNVNGVKSVDNRMTVG